MSKCGLCELHPKFPWEAADLHEALKQVRGVVEVKWQTSKTSQNNVGKHVSEHNILVYTDMSGAERRPLEFEVTRCNHMTDARVPYTVAVMFKTPPTGRMADAWRILAEVCKGKELLPLEFNSYMNKSLVRWCATPGSASDPPEEGTASATSAEANSDEQPAQASTPLEEGAASASVVSVKSVKFADNKELEGPEERPAPLDLFNEEEVD